MALNLRRGILGRAPFRSGAIRLGSIRHLFRDRTLSFWIDVAIHGSILTAMVVSAVAILWV